MTIAHQLRRGTNSQMNGFTGAVGEPTFDTTFNRLVLHDGNTAGGWPHALASVQTSTAASTSIGATTAVFFGYSTAAAQTVILPAASAYPPGQRLFIADGAGFAGTDNITVVTNSASDTVYTSTGGVSTTAMVINTNGGQCALYSNSSNHWLLESTS